MAFSQFLQRHLGHVIRIHGPAAAWRSRRAISKRQHWRGFPGIYALERAPMLAFHHAVFAVQKHTLLAIKFGVAPKKESALYLPCVEGSACHPGFADLAEARRWLEYQTMPDRESRPAMVVAYFTQDLAGNRAEYFDWEKRVWVPTRLELRAATALARQRQQ